MKVTEIVTVLRNVEYAGEFFINLQDLDELLKKDVLIEMEEVIITPYYIKNNKRLEMYQYEFCCMSDCDFNDYILKLTGKKRIEDIPNRILDLRKKCFSTINESNKLREFLDFLLNDKNLQEEIELVFGDYATENLYAVVY